MKFGVLQFFSWPERRIPIADVYVRALERIEIMDQTGYDAVWLAEHHFNSFSVCPSVHLMGTHIAARTQRLRVGTAVTLAALYHPLRIAEEVALLDVLSGGRVNWGAGRGFDPKEFGAFGVALEESASRFREAVEIVQQAWTQDRLTYHGEHFDFPPLRVCPAPAAAVPIWIGGASPAALRRAARLGDGWVGAGNTPDDAVALLDRIRELRVAVDRGDEPFEAIVPLVTPPDRDVLRRIADHGATGTVHYPFRYLLPEDATLDQKRDLLRRFGDEVIGPLAESDG